MNLAIRHHVLKTRGEDGLRGLSAFRVESDENVSVHRRSDPCGQDRPDTAVAAAMRRLWEFTRVARAAP